MSRTARKGPFSVGVWQWSNIRPVAWALRHVQVCLSTAGELWRNPFGTFMTAAVIGIALALPNGLYILFENVQRVSHGWDTSTQVSLFLKAQVSDGRALRMAEELRTRPELDTVLFITRAQALEEFRQLSGFGEVLEAFREDNPLPAVLVLYPNLERTSPEALQRMVEELREHPEVEIAQFNLQWLRRLQAIMAILQKGAIVLGALLILGVLLILANTIRLSIENQRDEIEVAKLFGATNAFIRRPFLYRGLWYGLLGAGLAWAVITGAFALLRAPVRELAELYYQDFLLVTLTGRATLGLLGTGAVLGVLGSWIAVAKHLHRFEPLQRAKSDGLTRRKIEP